MIVGVPKESLADERRVALTPGSLRHLTRLGVEVRIESGAGDAAGFPDKAFTDRDGVIVKDRAALFAEADIITQVNTYGANPDGKADLALMKKGQILIGFSDPLGAADRVKEIAETGVTAFGMELIPRITRAQSMDALSSMATIAGYKAVLLAAVRLPRMFPLFMTAAGTVKPARVFVIGAGVAGLQAIATAKRLGAVVQAYDVRPAVAEQVESVGGKFVRLEIDTSNAEDKGGYAKEQSEDQLKKQQELMGDVVAESDVVITTAAIPGRKSPVLVTQPMVERMDPGSVIIDLAAERGGNCELTQAGQDVIFSGVTIHGPINIPTTVPYHASQMYGNNVTTLLKHILDKEGNLALDMSDEINVGTVMCKDGDVIHPRLRSILGMPELEKPAEPEPEPESADEGKEG
jgi:NAD(P) transhydrogenase subunit alpha